MKIGSEIWKSAASILAKLSPFKYIVLSVKTLSRGIWNTENLKECLKNVALSYFASFRTTQVYLLTATSRRTGIKDKNEEK